MGNSRFLSVIGALAVASLSSSSAYALSYTITTVVDTSGAFEIILDPAINDNGTVVYVAGSEATGPGIYTDAGTLVVDNSGVFSSFRGPVINNNGTVAYWAFNDAAGQGIYTDAGTLVVDNSGAFLSIRQPAINDNGTVAYWASSVGTGGTSLNGIYTDAGTLVVDSIGMFSTFGGPVINNNETVAYSASADLPTGPHGIYTDAGTLVAGVSGVFNSFGDPAINDNGTVAYKAFLDAGGQGIYTDAGTLVVDDGGVFLKFKDPVINDSGQIAFWAQRDDGLVGIYIATPVPPLIEVDLQVKPGSDPAPINTKSNEVIPIAILTTDDFDATTMDSNTVCFGDAEDPESNGDCTEAHGRDHFDDVDSDGDLDMVLHFNIKDLGVEAGDEQACLTGKTFEGDDVAGCDEVKVK
jgi:flagellar basal body rod protein FlgF